MVLTNINKDKKHPQHLKYRTCLIGSYTSMCLNENYICKKVLGVIFLKDAQTSHVLFTSTWQNGLSFKKLQVNILIDKKDHILSF